MPAPGSSVDHARQRVVIDVFGGTPHGATAVWLRHGEGIQDGVLRAVRAGGVDGRLADRTARGLRLIGVHSESALSPGGLPIHLIRVRFGPEDAVEADDVPPPDLQELSGPGGIDDLSLPGAYTGHGSLGPDDPLRVQRPACYAVMRREDQVLLVRMRRLALWALPGGGIDIGEHPDQAVRREVFEESGFRVENARLIGTGTARWTGQAPHGQVQDFHAVHVYYRADAPAGQEPRVVEVDGSTEEAAWVHQDELATLHLTMAAAVGLRIAGVLCSSG